MFVRYDIWTVLEAIHKGGYASDGGTNYQISLTKQRALELYAELKKEFG